jgi:peptidyl-tRNA hydrolase ICT1
MLSRLLKASGTACTSFCSGLVQARVPSHRLIQFQRLRYFASGANNAGISGLPAPPLLTTLASEEDHNTASSWLDSFRTLGTGDRRMPRDVGELSFSRSSGPGGQNVNKVNTKATLRCSLAQAWIPKWAVPALKNDSHYVASTHSILVTSTVHRSQDQNIEECLKKLHTIIAAAAASCIQRGPSAAQKKKVEALAKADKARRKADKIARSSVKQGRRGGGGGFDY